MRISRRWLSNHPSQVPYGATASEVKSLKTIFEVDRSVKGIKTKWRIQDGRAKHELKTIPLLKVWNQGETASSWVSLLWDFTKADVHHEKMFSRVGLIILAIINQHPNPRTPSDVKLHVSQLCRTVSFLSDHNNNFLDKDLVNNCLSLIQSLMKTDSYHPTSYNYCDSLVAAAAVGNLSFFESVGTKFLVQHPDPGDLPAVTLLLWRITLIPRQLLKNSFILSFLSRLIKQRSPLLSLKNDIKLSDGLVDHFRTVLKVIPLLSRSKTNKNNREIAEAVRSIVFRSENEIVMKIVAEVLQMNVDTQIFSNDEIRKILSVTNAAKLPVSKHVMIIRSITKGKWVSSYNTCSTLLNNININSVRHKDISTLLWCSSVVRCKAERLWDSAGLIKQPTKSQMFQIIIAASTMNITQPRLWKVQLQTILQHKVISSFTKKDLLLVLECVARVRLAPDLIISNLPTHVFKRCSDHLIDSGMSSCFSTPDVQRLCTAHINMSLKLPESVASSILSNCPDSKDIISSIGTYK